MPIMIDIETLGTSVNSVVLIICAKRFNESDSSDLFYKKIDIKSCLELGLEIDDNTLKWWKTQPSEVYKEAFEGEREHIKIVLNELKRWIKKDDIIWCNGLSFDVPILENLFRLCKIDIPWKYWNTRDTRTLYDIAGIKNWDLPKNNKHDARDDCDRQIWGVLESFKRLNKK